MTYELAKKLEDAGFPKDEENGRVVFDSNSLKLSTDYGAGMEGNCAYLPILSELIEACGDRTIMLWGCKHKWYVQAQTELENFTHSDLFSGKDIIEAGAEGSTPEEAVANLWLALNKK